MKSLILLLVIICCCGCNNPASYRDDDRFVIKGINLWGDKYRYEYTLYHIVDGKFCYETIMYSNEKYELNDTLRLMK